MKSLYIILILLFLGCSNITSKRNLASSQDNFFIVEALNESILALKNALKTLEKAQKKINSTALDERWNKFIENIILQRNAKGPIQKLADHFNVSKYEINKLENPNKSSSFEIFIKVSLYLDLANFLPLKITSSIGDIDPVKLKVDYNKLGKLIQKQRNELEIPSTHLGKEINISHPTVKHIEQGKSTNAKSIYKVLIYFFDEYKIIFDLEDFTSF